MEPTDLTIEILKGIRDEVRSTREELRAELRSTREELHAELRSTREDLSARIDETNAGLASLREQQVHTEIRLATELVALSSAVRTVAEHLREPREGALRARVEDHERRLEELEKRTA
jgi:hypothetical protein